MINYAFIALLILAVVTLVAIITNHKRPIVPFILTPVLLVATFTIYSAYDTILGKPHDYNTLEQDDYIIYSVLQLQPNIYVTLGHHTWETPKFYWLPFTKENSDKMTKAQAMIEQQGVSKMEITQTEGRDDDSEFEVGEFTLVNKETNQ